MKLGTGVLVWGITLGCIILSCCGVISEIALWLCVTGSFIYTIYYTKQRFIYANNMFAYQIRMDELDKDFNIKMLSIQASMNQPNKPVMGFGGSEDAIATDNGIKVGEDSSSNDGEDGENDEELEEDDIPDSIPDFIFPIPGECNANQ
jgi:hypothetical protein